MNIEAHVEWLTNTKRKKYEDRFVMPLGELPERLEAAQAPADEQRIQAQIDYIAARGLLFAVMDGVGGAPLGMAAAQKTADFLRELYTREALAPAEGFPSAKQVLDLLHEANSEIHAWGPIEDDDIVASGTSERPKGAACASVVYFSPAGNATVLQAGDTSVFVYRASKQLLEHYTGAADLAGRAVRKYIGLGDALYIDAFSLAPLEGDDMIALVTDGVYPKGFPQRGEIQSLLAEAAGNPEWAADQLVQRARSRRSSDDITALALALG